MRNRDCTNPVVALADALREAHPSMFGGAAASSVEEADRLYERVAQRLINLGERLASEPESSGANGAVSRAGDSSVISPPRGRPPGWRLVIERAWNGYLVTDTTRTGGWLVARDDPLEAAAELLDELNERLGTDGRPEDERRVVVTLEAGDAWLAAHPATCPHDNIRNLDYLEDPNREGWACGCGVPSPQSTPAKARLNGDEERAGHHAPFHSLVIAGGQCVGGRPAALGLDASSISNRDREHLRGVEGLRGNALEAAVGDAGVGPPALRGRRAHRMAGLRSRRAL